MANVVITGSNRGIGLELARQYSAAGDRVFACCRNPADAEALQAVAARSGGLLTLQQLDVADPDSILQAARHIGEVPVDILINNAGVLGGTHAEQTFEAMNFDNWRYAIEVMTFGPFRMLQAFIGKLARSNTAKVVTITSQVGASTWPQTGLYTYAGAKAASNRLVRGLAIELEPRGIIVIAMHPGYVKTDMSRYSADISAEESAAGIRTVVAGLGREDSGKFFKWNGEIHPW